MKKTIVILILIILASVIGNVLFLSQDVFQGTYIAFSKETTGFLSFDENTFSREIYRESGWLEDSTYGFYTTAEQYKNDIKYIVNGVIMNTGLDRYTIFVLCEGNSWYYVSVSAIIIQAIWLAVDICLMISLIKKLPKIKIVLENKTEVLAMKKAYIKAICLAIMFITIFINLIFLFYPLYHGSLWGTYSVTVDGQQTEISFDGISYQMSVSDQAHSQGIYEYKRNADMLHGYEHYGLIELDNDTKWGMGNVFGLKTVGCDAEYTLYNVGAIICQVVFSVVTFGAFSVFVVIKAKED